MTGKELDKIEEELGLMPKEISKKKGHFSFLRRKEE
jgi:hypothetical protein